MLFVLKIPLKIKQLQLEDSFSKSSSLYTHFQILFFMIHVEQPNIINTQNG